jgi:hypothetical protein
LGTFFRGTGSYFLSTEPRSLVMKRLLIYLSAVGVCLAVLPNQAEAGSRDKKDYRRWGRHHGYYTREYYRHCRPHRYWRYHSYYGYHHYPYRYYGYSGRPTIGFSLQFD